MLAPATAPVTAGDVLTLDEIRSFRRTSTLRGAGLVLHAWVTIAGAMFVYARWPSWLTLAAAVAVIGSRQLGLLVLMHEGAHWLLFPHPRVTTRVASWLCAAPVWADLASYRRRHHLHHRHTQQPGDPDLALASSFPASRGALGRSVLADLSGWTFATRVLSWPPWRESPGAAWRRLRAPVISNAVILGVLGGAGYGYLYPLLWLLPLVTWHQLVDRLRTIAEHGAVPDDDDPLRNTRTTAAGVLARAFVAPYWVNYHVEHHLLVFVPCWKLRRAHALLVARGHASRMERARSYREALLGPARRSR